MLLIIVSYKYSAMAQPVVSSIRSTVYTYLSVGNLTDTDPWA